MDVDNINSISDKALVYAQTFLGQIPNDKDHERQIEYLAFLFDKFKNSK